MCLSLPTFYYRRDTLRPLQIQRDRAHADGAGLGYRPVGQPPLVLEPKNLTNLPHQQLYGRLPDGKVDSVWVGTGCSSISGLFVQGVYLLALMELADPRLIPPEGFTPCC